MNANKPASRRSLKSDLARVDAHVVKKVEYEELPELTEEMLVRAKLAALELTDADVADAVRWARTGTAARDAEPHSGEAATTRSSQRTPAKKKPAKRK